MTNCKLTRRCTRPPEARSEERAQGFRRRVSLVVKLLSSGLFFTGDQQRWGKFLLDRPLTAEHKAILEDLYEEEHTPGEDGKPDGFQCYYCQWVATEDGVSIVWDGGEKFYCYIEWLKYLIDRHLKPWGYVLNGTVRWQGEGGAEWHGQEIDRGTLYVRHNQVEAVLDGTSEASAGTAQPAI